MSSQDRSASPRLGRFRPVCQTPEPLNSRRSLPRRLCAAALFDLLRLQLGRRLLRAPAPAPRIDRRRCAHTPPLARRCPTTLSDHLRPRPRRSWPRLQLRHVAAAVIAVPICHCLCAAERCDSSRDLYIARHRLRLRHPPLPLHQTTRCAHLLPKLGRKSPSPPKMPEVASFGPSSINMGPGGRILLGSAHILETSTEFALIWTEFASKSTNFARCWSILACFRTLYGFSRPDFGDIGRIGSDFDQMWLVFH